MRSAVNCLIILITTGMILSCTNQEQPAAATVISGATLFDGTGSDPFENSVIVIRDQQIECVGSQADCPVPAGAEVIEASGKYITPGLVDAHMHFAQTGFFDGRPDALDIRDVYPYTEVAAYQKLHPDRYYDSYLCSGVTAVYDVGGMSWSVDLQTSAEADSMAPHVAASGPLLTPVPGAPFDLPSDRALVQLDSEQTGIEMVQFLSELGSTGIKFWQFQADNEEYMARVAAAAEEIRRQGNQMIAHATTLEQAKAALRNGTKLLVHSVSDIEVDDEFIRLALEHETIYNPTIIVDDGYLKAYRAAAGIEPMEVSDPRGCVDEQTLGRINNADQLSDHPQFNEQFIDYIERGTDPQRMYDSDFIVRLNLIKVHEAGIPVVVGTDAGNPGTLHGISIYDEMEAMQEAGIAAEDLIVMATQNGAMAMQRLEDFGTLETGKFANLIILEEDPSEDISNMRSLSDVMIKGAFYKTN